MKRFKITIHSLTLHVLIRHSYSCIHTELHSLFFNIIIHEHKTVTVNLFKLSTIKLRSCSKQIATDGKTSLKKKTTVPAHIASSKACFLATNKAPLGSLLFGLDWGQAVRG